LLIYLSSYPRSGNTWVRVLTRFYFDRRSSSIYPEEKGDPNLERNEDGSFGPAFSEYQAQYPPIVTRKRLVNGCAPILSEEFRQHLGSLDEYFFLKTHELPFNRYFDGEYVIHLTRHPGAVFWSYYNFLRDNEPEIAANLTLEEVIKGNVPFGSWSTYNEQWLECSQVLGDRFLLYSYEQLSLGEANYCEKVSSLTGLPICVDFGTSPDFDYWHRFAPKLFRRGEVNEWQSHFLPSQLKLIKLFHDPTMEKLGYELDQQPREALEVSQAEMLFIIREQNEEIIHLRAALGLVKRDITNLESSLRDQSEVIQAQKCKLDELEATLLAISHTRTYKLLRYLGRWKSLEIPSQIG
jgi:hypothetical protein